MTCAGRVLTGCCPGLARLPGKRSLFWFLVQPGRQTPGSAFAEMNLRMLVLTGSRERTIDDCSDFAAGACLQVTAFHMPPDVT